MTLLFSGTANDLEFEEVRIPKYKYAIVRHDPRDGVAGTNLDNTPDTIALQGSPHGDEKGTQIPILPQWWDYIAKINSAGGLKYTRGVGYLWINKPYSAGETPRAESIICGGNPIAYTDETNTHVKLVSFPVNFDTRKLFPAYDNWQNFPFLFWKACSIDKYGNIFKVASSLDVYYPLIGNELWIPKSRLEFFPAGYDYRLSGCNVWDGERPLMIVDGRDRTFYNGWRINTLGVVPPA